MRPFTRRLAPRPLVGPTPPGAARALGPTLALALTLGLGLPTGARADCPPTRGDLAPGMLDDGTDPPTWTVEGDAFVTVGDVVALLRAITGLQQIEWSTPTSPTCPPLPGDFAPGRLDESTLPPTWNPDPDGLLTVGDAVALVRVAVNLQTLGPGLAECAHFIEPLFLSSPRSTTDRRCPVGVSADMQIIVTAADPENQEVFVLDGYTVTYENVSRGGADEAGVDVPQPVNATLFLDPGVPIYDRIERISILDEAAKTLPPLNQDSFYVGAGEGGVLFEATVTVFGRAVDRPEATCTGMVLEPIFFSVRDSGPGTDPETDPECLAEQEEEEG